ncbi:MAG: hypothetical protein ACT4OY_00590 [Alphaproteobacteria bacterium]
MMEENLERKTILQVYAVFGVGLVFSVIPFFAAAGLSLVLVMVTLIAAYIIRSGAQDASLTENHMTYIIRTIWIGSFIASLTLIAASLYLLAVIDNTPLDPCIQKFYQMSMGGMTFDVQTLSGTFEACAISYIVVNLNSFLIAAAIGALPVLVYFGARYAHGLNRALKGYRIAKPDTWF